MVNPPGNAKAAFRTATANPADTGEFLAAASTVAGSWWTDYAAWLASRGGGQKGSPPALGGPDHPVRGAAPGTYVHDR
jgi:poly(3-hydroxyalkanoate) synthetase